MIKEKQPLITIITVVYNGEATLKDTIESVINVNYRNIDYFVIDGGSKDGTVDVIKRYASYIKYWISEII
jgi:glycosyltransferase involved in cell wall biosynthesis